MVGSNAARKMSSACSHALGWRKLRRNWKKRSCPCWLRLNTRSQPGNHYYGKTAPPSGPSWRHSDLLHR